MSTGSFEHALRRARRSARAADRVLTRSELRIARMAAAGMKNREIAAASYVSVKAVEFHLANAYRKLEIEGRRELGHVLPRVAA